MDKTIKQEDWAALCNAAGFKNHNLPTVDWFVKKIQAEAQAAKNYQDLINRSEKLKAMAGLPSKVETIRESLSLALSTIKDLQTTLGLNSSYVD